MLEATDLVALIGEHVALRPKGREHVGLCPFHEDRTPSLAVVTHKESAFYKCFACGAAGNAIDGNPATYWATDDGVTTGALELTLAEPRRFDQVAVREAVALGQRVEEWAIEAEVDGAWRTLARGSTIGIRRILRFPQVTSHRVRVVVVRARACPAIAEVGLYLSAR